MDVNENRRQFFERRNKNKDRVKIPLILNKDVISESLQTLLDSVDSVVNVNRNSKRKLFNHSSEHKRKEEPVINNSDILKSLTALLEDVSTVVVPTAFKHRAKSVRLSPDERREKKAKDSIVIKASLEELLNLQD